MPFNITDSEQEGVLILKLEGRVIKGECELEFERVINELKEKRPKKSNYSKRTMLL